MRELVLLVRLVLLAAGIFSSGDGGCIGSVDNFDSVGSVVSVDSIGSVINVV